MKNPEILIIRKILILLALLLVQFSLVNGQFKEASISFAKLNHNFGNIAEESGVAHYTFEFTNNGSQPLVIQDVSTSCGCTVPEWSKQPILAGGKGKIEVRFDPADRPGAFRKTITVRSNAREPVTTLYIVGYVNPKPKSVADNYPVLMGQIRFRSNHFSMMNIRNNESKMDTLGIFNMSDQPVRITFPEMPPFLSFQVRPEILEPKGKGVIMCTLDGSKIDDWGFIIHKVPVYFDGVAFTQNLIAVSATVLEDFSQLTPLQRENVPVASFDSDAYNFGDIHEGTRVDHDFILTNNGKDPLIIRKVTTTCGCTVSEPSLFVIPGGKQSIISCTFDGHGKVGKQFHTVSLILNDPDNPQFMLRMIGNVLNK